MFTLFVLSSVLSFSLVNCSPDFGQFNISCDNDRPVIGVLSLPSWDEIKQVEDNRSSYIVASYVKFLESAGARVIPVLPGHDEAYYQEMVNLTNGFLFTGGGLWLSTSMYTTAASYIWKHALKLNSEGDFYPIWGTCLGLELIAYLANDLVWPLTNCSSWDAPLKLNFSMNSQELKSTSLFSGSDESIIEILSKENVTINYHHQCLTPETVESSKLAQSFRILSTNKDKRGIEFVSIMEGKTLPVYLVQFHPERVLFEPNYIKSFKRTPHSANAVKVSQYFANFFVNQARKNCHIYPNTDEYHAKLIYNYCPQFSGLEGGHEQTYYFKW
ncbi:gamma-glutamyl hydrolase [Tetranychus urticae]|uniref:folate gamma-glutamyl hydrolase n=1 Tax=Tetranychus urticae TaxID=32264 RepID=T1K6V3_TETUR|nr:gamma-glutamyl hydrolase [Tetranychus urticae]